MNAIPPEGLRVEVETIALEFLNALFLRRAACQQRHEEALVAGNVLVAVELAKGVHFLENVYGKGLEILRDVATKEGVTQ